MLPPARRYLTDDELKLCDLRETDEVRKYHDPTIRVFQYLGLMVIVKTDNGMLDFQWFSLHFFYCLLCLTSHYYFIYIASVERQRYMSERSGRSFDEDLYLYSLYAFYLFEGIAIAYLFESRKMVNHYNLLSVFQARYYHANGTSVASKLRNYSGYWAIIISGTIVILFLVITFFNIQNIYKKQDDDIRPMIENLASCVWITIDVVSLMLLWITHMISLYCIASTFADEMINAFRNGDEDSIRNYEKLWFDLMYLIKNLGNIFTYSQGYYFVLAILTMTFELFLAIRQEYMILIMYGIGLFLTLLFIIYYSDKLIFMVTEGLAEELLEIRKNCSNRRRQHISRFIKSIRTFGGKISLGGFSSVDNGLASSVLSNLTTYIIILLQFKFNNKTSPQGSDGKV